MGFAYTPGLTVSANPTIRHPPRLPLTGDVWVKVGAHGTSDRWVGYTMAWINRKGETPAGRG